MVRKPLFGAAAAYDDSLALARDPDVDIVAVTVKVPEHRAIVLGGDCCGQTCLLRMAAGS